MTPTPQFIYDQVPYEGYPITPTHPDRIIPVAAILGLTAAPAHNCRVLELGCGDGVNLIPMASVLPGSVFLGVDLAHKPIGEAASMVEALGLSNIRFQQLNVMDFDSSYGEFDYILAHGLYSWVPSFVRDKIMSICQSHLSPNGIAYISYNVYPGCHIRKMMSGMMSYHAQGTEEPREKIAKTQELLAFLSAGKPDSVSLADELKQYKERRPHSLLHDDLSDENHPVYFHEFASHAAGHGLQFLAEADFFEMQPYNFPPEVQQHLVQLAAGDTIRYEQYLDFLKNRRFRKTLLCRQEAAISRSPSSRPIRSLYIASPASAVSSQPDVRSEKEESFKGPKGGALRTGLPALKATIVELAKIWPAVVSFEELIGLISEYLEERTEESDSVLAEMLLRCFMAGMVELHALPSAFARSAGKYPFAFPFARLQAEKGNPAVCNLRHTTIELDEASLLLLTLLDGTLDTAAILQRLLEMGVTPGAGRTLELDEVQANIDKMAHVALLRNGPE